MTILSHLLLAAAAIGLVYTGLALAVLALERRAYRRRRPRISFTPPVTIFKPLKGVDEHLEENLTRFFELGYPKYELLFGVADADDPAIEIVRNLQARYPNIASRLIIDSHRTGHNPKVNNLCNMASFARHDYWVISDSNVRVESNYLTNLVAAMSDPGVGLVTSLIRGVGGCCLGARLENLHLNSFVAAASVAVTKLSNVPVSIGKSMLVRRDIIAALGGFETFADYLLEDGLLGRSIRQLGLRTIVSFHAVENSNDSWTIENFMQRHYRWGLMRRRLNLGHYFGEVLANPSHPALLAGMCTPAVWPVVLAIVGLKLSLDLATIRVIGGSLTPGSLLLLPLKDALIGLIWWKPLFTDRVTWRGHRFRIGAMTRITPDRSAHRPLRQFAFNWTDSLRGAYRSTRRL